MYVYMTWFKCISILFVYLYLFTKCSHQNLSSLRTFLVCLCIMLITYKLQLLILTIACWRRDCFIIRQIAIIARTLVGSNWISTSSISITSILIIALNNIWNITEKNVNWLAKICYVYPNEYLHIHDKNKNAMCPMSGSQYWINIDFF